MSLHPPLHFYCPEISEVHHQTDTLEVTDPYSSSIHFNRTPEDSQAILEGDLALTAKCLLRNPKEYAVWEHRKWILKTMPDPDWGYEFKMVQGLLERDARNCKHGRLVSLSSICS